ncbi:MAG: hypothetical protein GXX83_05675 [Gaiellales bacterium]|nr:hypothetical protein [Gaiellales bacterium]
MKTIAKTKLIAFLEALSDDYRVVVPLQQGTEVEMGELDGGRLAVGYRGKTRFSAKECLFPESEVMLTFDNRGAGAVETTEHTPAEKTAVWGVRPCDLAGMATLDAVFLSPPVDTYYYARRANTLLLGLNCHEVGTSCFCRSFAAGPFASSGFDMIFTDVAERFLVESGSEVGARLLEQHGELFAEAGEADRQEAESLRLAAETAFTTTLDVPALLVALQEAFDDGVWEEQAKKCTLCGTCCIVCPTCHCFNVEDVRKTRKLFQRVRYWDSCQFTGFTRMAAENSRSTQGERWRQKIYDKFVYLPAVYDGLLGCTGCGRCLDLCQGNINIVQVLEKVSHGH